MRTTVADQLAAAGAITMRASILNAENELLTDEVRLAAPRAGEVLVKIEAAGLCHSDLSAVTGKIPTKLPAVLGHEGAGIVEAVGAGVTRIRPGQHVALSWAPYCGHCENCLRELPHLCSAGWDAMFEGCLLDGTSRLSWKGEPLSHYSLLSSFAEYAVVPEASCVTIQEDVRFDVAAIVGCAVTTGIGAIWNTAKVRPGDRVAVFGLGGVGLSALLGAVAAGASPIVAVDTQPEKLETALALGATDAVLWEGSPDEMGARVARAAGGGVDYAVEAIGRPDTMRAAFMSTRVRGAAVLIGIPSPDGELQIPAISIPRMERRILGSMYGSARPDRDFPLILELYKAGRLPLEALITERIALDAIPAGFDAMSKGQTIRTVVVPGR